MNDSAWLLKPLEEVPFVVLDLELTGLDDSSDSILAIGAVKMTGGRIELGRTFHRLVRPETQMKPDAILVHQILPEEAALQAPLPEVLGEFLKFAGDAVAVGYHVGLDLSFLARWSERSLRRAYEPLGVDTYALAHWLRSHGPSSHPLAPPETTRDLYALAEALEIPVCRAHDAAADAYLTAQALQRMLPALASLGVTTLQELIQAGDPQWSPAKDMLKGGGYPSL